MTTKDLKLAISMLTKIFNCFFTVFQRIKDAFKGNARFKPSVIDGEISAMPPRIKRPGRGAYFHNNRKRTAGRNVQYIQLANGNTKLIRHETI